MASKRPIFANLVSFATILAPPDMGQTRVAEVGLESGLYCYMFCDGSEDFVRFQDPAVTNLRRQIAPRDSVVGSADWRQLDLPVNDD